MANLGHEWTAGIVGFVERNDRVVGVGELLSLALVLNLFVADLLDPRGIDGRGNDRLDYGHPDLQLPAGVIGPWLHGEVDFRLTAPTSFDLCAVDGHDAAYEKALAAWQADHQLIERRTGKRKS